MSKTELKELDFNGIESIDIKVNTELDEKSRQDVAGALAQVLANSYMLMLKTQNYHWNVQGTLFKPIHELTEEAYDDLFEAIDDLAERIRALGHFSPGTFGDFQNLSKITEGNAKLNEKEMLAELLEDNEKIANIIHGAIQRAEEHDDFVTSDMLTDRLTVHDKTAWMMRSTLEQ